MGDHRGVQLADKHEYGNLAVEIHYTQHKSSFFQRLFPLKNGAHHWVLVSLSIVALVGGQCSATLLSRFYFEKGGSSSWLITLIPNVGWPILIIPLVFSRKQQPSSPNPLKPKKIGPYVLNSLVLLTFSAALLGLIHSSGNTEGHTRSSHFVLGYVYTISASVLIGLILPLMQLVFTKVLGTESLTAVLEMQIYTSIVSTIACMVGLYISGELQRMREEAYSFKAGKKAYCMTLLWTAIGWQIHSVGLYGLISLVSSLYGFLPTLRFMYMLYFLLAGVCLHCYCQN